MFSISKGKTNIIIIAIFVYTPLLHFSIFSISKMNIESNLFLLRMFYGMLFLFWMFCIMNQLQFFNLKLLILSTCVLSSHHLKNNQGWKNAFCIIYRQNMSCKDSWIYHELLTLPFLTLLLYLLGIEQVWASNECTMHKVCSDYDLDKNTIKHESTHII